jgi:hypothetical protein
VVLENMIFPFMTMIPQRAASFKNGTNTVRSRAFHLVTADVHPSLIIGFLLHGDVGCTIGRHVLVLAFVMNPLSDYPVKAKYPFGVLNDVIFSSPVLLRLGCVHDKLRNRILVFGQPLVNPIRRIFDLERLELIAAEESNERLAGEDPI